MWPLFLVVGATNLVLRHPRTARTSGNSSRAPACGSSGAAAVRGQPGAMRFHRGRWSGQARWPPGYARAQGRRRAVVGRCSTPELRLGPAAPRSTSVRAQRCRSTRAPGHPVVRRGRADACACGHRGGRCGPIRWQSGEHHAQPATVQADATAPVAEAVRLIDDQPPRGRGDLRQHLIADIASIQPLGATAPSTHPPERSL